MAENRSRADKTGPSSSLDTPNIYNHLNKLAFPRSAEPRSVAILPHAEVCPSR